MKNFKKNNKQAGFSIIEVMMALVIAAISLVGLTLSITNYVNQLDILRSRVWEQDIVWNVLSNIYITNGTNSQPKLQGASEYLGIKRQWQISTTKSDYDYVEGFSLIFGIDGELKRQDVKGYLFTPPKVN